LEEKFEALMKSYQTVSSTNQELKQQNDYMKNSNQELKQQNKYLRRQLSKAIKMKQRVLESASGLKNDDMSVPKSEHSKFEGEVKPRRMTMIEWHPTSNSNDVRVNILEFEGKLDPDEFLPTRDSLISS